MDRRYIKLILILVLVGLVAWMDIPNDTGISIGPFQRTMQPVLGLDLRGGIQVLLQPVAGSEVTQQNLEDAASILENRSNGLGVSEVVFQIAGGQYILGEFPGATDTEQVVNIIQQTGLLEFIDAGTTYLEPGTVVQTDHAGLTAGTTTNADGTTTTVYHSVMTGADIQTVAVGQDSSSVNGGSAVNFVLTDNGAQIFSDWTSAHVGQYLAIVLDGTVISCPTISTAITGGQGQISGNFSIESANNMAVTLRYGSLPVELDIVQSNLIGPSLGEDSLNKSLLAGLIGFIIIALFMSIYYRMPGVLAVLSIVVFAGITYALFVLIPVTLTLPGVAGFLLSTGSALDANILMFERMKEELRNGRTLSQALRLGWKRAWSSIRDSNIATIITSIILFWFGSAFGASMVKGFAFTLALGVVVSMFCAVFVTRTFLDVAAAGVKPENRLKWFGA